MNCPCCRDCGQPLSEYDLEVEHTYCEQCRAEDGPMHGTGYGDNVNGGLNR